MEGRNRNELAASGGKGWRIHGGGFGADELWRAVNNRGRAGVEEAAAARCTASRPRGYAAKSGGRFLHDGGRNGCAARFAAAAAACGAGGPRIGARRFHQEQWQRG